MVRVIMPFTPAALRFLRGLARNNFRPWFEAHETDYERDVKAPMRELIEDLAPGSPTRRIGFERIVRHPGLLRRFRGL